MENNFRSYLDSARSVLIILPKKPYFDQVAAGLSLYLALLGKKEVDIVCPNPMLVEFNRLVGVDKVKSELGNKNLVIRIANYKASDVERVSSEVKNEELYLTVIPQPGVNPPLKDQVMLSHSGVSADLIILIGGRRLPQLPKKDYPQGAIPAVQPTFQAASVENKEEKKEEDSLEETPPQDWLAPKIFKGTSVS
jgi:hypothetical protein